MTFSAINEVNTPRTPSGETRWPTVQEKPSQVQLWLDHTLRA